MKFAVLMSLGCIVVVSASADDTKINAIAAESYVRPPKEIEEVVTAPWYRNGSVTNVGPNRTHYIVSVSSGLPKLADLARPYHNLGGVQLDWRANRTRNLSFRRTEQILVKRIGDDNTVTINAPKGTSIGSPTWSPDGKRIAFFGHSDRATHLWVVDAATGKAKQITQVPVLATFENQFEWLSDSKRIAAVFVPAKRAPMPVNGEVALAPQVKISDDKTNAIRTYAGLMNTPHEFELFEWHATGQLGVVDADSGRMVTIGAPAMIENISPQADGSHFRVTLIEKPFSYMVPASSFPEREVLWSATGKQVLEISKRPLRFGTTSGGAGQGGDNEKRSLTWRPDGQGFSFLQVSAARREGGSPDGQESDEQGRRPGGAQGAPGGQQLRPGQKDRVMQWVAPYGESDAKPIFESDQRISSVQYSEDCKTLFISQTIGGRNRLSAVRIDNPSKLYTIVESATGDNAFYEDPGSLMTREGRVAGSIVRMSNDGKFVYLSGTKYSKDPLKEGPKPFLDRVEIETGKRDRLFESSPDRYETASMVDDDGKLLLVSRQSPTSISQTYLVDSTTKQDVRQLTANRDYAPDLTQASKRRFTVTRPDGLKFDVTVTYPAGAKPGAKLPAFFWFYPSEFVDQAAYDRSNRTFNKNTFSSISPSSKKILLRAGYALVEPDCPIIGAETRKNDGYVPQLRNNLSATINAICDDGTIDRNKLGIGGHSYGAFSTLNAMVHTPYFKAGIAGDGNYNRLLTPFGFQGETRQLWESREVYLSMSPMLYLEQLTGAVLLYHGIDDQNMGTDPINSPKLFAALEALGKPAAMYMYPYEDHGQIAEETVLDQWARFVAWLDKWVKNGGK